MPNGERKPISFAEYLNTHAPLLAMAGQPVGTVPQAQPAPAAPVDQGNFLQEHNPFAFVGGHTPLGGIGNALEPAAAGLKQGADAILAGGNPIDMAMGAAGIGGTISTVPQDAVKASVGNAMYLAARVSKQFGPQAGMLAAAPLLAGGSLSIINGGQQMANLAVFAPDYIIKAHEQGWQAPINPVPGPNGTSIVPAVGNENAKFSPGSRAVWEAAVNTLSTPQRLFNDLTHDPMLAAGALGEAAAAANMPRLAKGLEAVNILGNGLDGNLLENVGIPALRKTAPVVAGVGSDLLRLHPVTSAGLDKAISGVQAAAPVARAVTAPIRHLFDYSDETKRQQAADPLRIMQDEAANIEGRGADDVFTGEGRPTRPAPGPRNGRMLEWGRTQDGHSRARYFTENARVIDSWDSRGPVDQRGSLTFQTWDGHRWNDQTSAAYHGREERQAQTRTMLTQSEDFLLRQQAAPSLTPTTPQQAPLSGTAANPAASTTGSPAPSPSATSGTAPSANAGQGAGGVAPTTGTATTSPTTTQPSTPTAGSPPASVSSASPPPTLNEASEARDRGFAGSREITDPVIVTDFVSAGKNSYGHVIIDYDAPDGARYELTETTAGETHVKYIDAEGRSEQTDTVQGAAIDVFHQLRTDLGDTRPIRNRVGSPPSGLLPRRGAQRPDDEAGVPAATEPVAGPGVPPAAGPAVEQAAGGQADAERPDLPAGRGDLPADSPVPGRAETPVDAQPRAEPPVGNGPPATEPAVGDLARGDAGGDQAAAAGEPSLPAGDNLPPDLGGGEPTAGVGGDEGLPEVFRDIPDQPRPTIEVSFNRRDLDVIKRTVPEGSDAERVVLDIIDNHPPGTRNFYDVPLYEEEVSSLIDALGPPHPNDSVALRTIKTDLLHAALDASSATSLDDMYGMFPEYHPRTWGQVPDSTPRVEDVVPTEAPAETPTTPPPADAAAPTTEETGLPASVSPRPEEAAPLADETPPPAEAAPGPTRRAVETEPTPARIDLTPEDVRTVKQYLRENHFIKNGSSRRPSADAREMLAAIEAGERPDGSVTIANPRSFDHGVVSEALDRESGQINTPTPRESDSARAHEQDAADLTHWARRLTGNRDLSVASTAKNTYSVFDRDGNELLKLKAARRSRTGFRYYEVLTDEFGTSLGPDQDTLWQAAADTQRTATGRSPVAPAGDVDQRATEPMPVTPETSTAEAPATPDVAPGATDQPTEPRLRIPPITEAETADQQRAGLEGWLRDKHNLDIHVRANDANTTASGRPHYDVYVREANGDEKKLFSIGLQNGGQPDAYWQAFEPTRAGYREYRRVYDQTGNVDSTLADTDRFATPAAPPEPAAPAPVSGQTPNIYRAPTTGEAKTMVDIALRGDATHPDLANLVDDPKTREIQDRRDEAYQNAYGSQWWEKSGEADDVLNQWQQYADDGNTEGMAMAAHEADKMGLRHSRDLGLVTVRHIFDNLLSVAEAHGDDALHGKEINFGVGRNMNDDAGEETGGMFSVLRAVFAPSRTSSEARYRAKFEADWEGKTEAQRNAVRKINDRKPTGPEWVEARVAGQMKGGGSAVKALTEIAKTDPDLASDLAGWRIGYLKMVGEEADPNIAAFLQDGVSPEDFEPRVMYGSGFGQALPFVDAALKRIGRAGRSIGGKVVQAARDLPGTIRDSSLADYAEGTDVPTPVTPPDNDVPLSLREQLSTPSQQVASEIWDAPGPYEGLDVLQVRQVMREEAADDLAEYQQVNTVGGDHKRAQELRDKYKHAMPQGYSMENVDPGLLADNHQIEEYITMKMGVHPTQTRGPLRNAFNFLRDFNAFTSALLLNTPMNLAYPVMNLLPNALNIAQRDPRVAAHMLAHGGTMTALSRALHGETNILGHIGDRFAEERMPSEVWFDELGTHVPQKIATGLSAQTAAHTKGARRFIGRFINTEESVLNTPLTAIEGAARRNQMVESAQRAAFAETRSKERVAEAWAQQKDGILSQLRDAGFQWTDELDDTLPPAFGAHRLGSNVEEIAANHGMDEAEAARLSGVAYNLWRDPSLQAGVHDVIDDVRKYLTVNEGRNIDRYAGAVFPFTFWTARMTKNMLVNLIGNPVLAAQYLHFQRWAENEQAKNPTMPPYLKGMIALGASPYGYMMMLNPRTWLMTSQLMREDSSAQGWTPTMVDNVLQGLQNETGLQPWPAITALLQTTGLSHQPYAQSPVSSVETRITGNALDWLMANIGKQHAYPLQKEIIYKLSQLRSSIAGEPNALADPQEQMKNPVHAMILQQNPDLFQKAMANDPAALQEIADIEDNEDDPRNKAAWKAVAAAGLFTAAWNGSITGAFHLTKVNPASLFLNAATTSQVASSAQPLVPPDLTNGAWQTDPNWRSHLTGGPAPDIRQTNGGDTAGAFALSTIVGGTPQAQQLAAQEAQYRQAGTDFQRQVAADVSAIRNGKTQRNVNVYDDAGNLQSYTPAQIAAMDDAGRQDVAARYTSQHTDEQGLPLDYDLQQLSAARDAALVNIPEYASYKKWQASVYDTIDAGMFPSVMAWAEREAVGNPDFARFLEGVKNSVATGERTSDQAESKLVSTEAYLIEHGIAKDVTDPSPMGGQTGVNPEDIALLGGGGGGGNGPYDPAAAVTQQISQYQSDVAIANAAFANAGIPYQWTNNGNPMITNALENFLRAHALPVPYLNRDAQTYLIWKQTRPNGTPQQWLQERQGIAAAALTPPTTPALAGARP